MVCGFCDQKGLQKKKKTKKNLVCPCSMVQGTGYLGFQGFGEWDWQGVARTWGIKSRQVKQALGFSYAIGLGHGGMRVTPWLAYWPGVLVHWAWATLNGPGLDPGPRPTHYPRAWTRSGQAELWDSARSHWKTGLWKAGLENQHTPGHKDVDLLGDVSMGMRGREDP